MSDADHKLNNNKAYDENYYFYHYPGIPFPLPGCIGKILRGVPVSAQRETTKMNFLTT